MSTSASSSGPHAASSARQRAEAAIAVVRERGALAWHVHNAFSLDLEPPVVAALEQRRATAVIAGADLIAIGVMRHIRAMGLSTPDDVSVVGFDDIPWAQLHTPALTTIDMPVEDMATAAMETLVRRMAHGASRAAGWCSASNWWRGVGEGPALSVERSLWPSRIVIPPIRDRPKIEFTRRSRLFGRDDS